MIVITERDNHVVRLLSLRRMANSAGFHSEGYTAVAGRVSLHYQATSLGELSVHLGPKSVVTPDNVSQVKGEATRQLKVGSPCLPTSATRSLPVSLTLLWIINLFHSAHFELESSSSPSRAALIATLRMTTRWLASVATPSGRER